jgi:hypothetical protein
MYFFTQNKMGESEREKEELENQITLENFSAESEERKK